MRLVSVLDSWDGQDFTGPALFAIDGDRLTLVEEQATDDRGTAPINSTAHLNSTAPINSTAHLNSTAPINSTAHIPGTLFPGFTDSHVHLGLVDPNRLVPGGIARVVDLGSDPALLRDLAASSPVDIEYAGAFLTAAGGYPVGRDWAPVESIREVMSARESAAAVDEMAVAGASVIKVVVNSTGPVWDDRMLHAVVRQAHDAGLPVVAHAEGTGQAMRAVRAGVDRLAHTPWTELLADDDVREAAETCSWVSTLDIHGWGDRGPEFGIAMDNLSRFASAGGHVLYGTDLGNGPLPVGVNTRELEALIVAGLSVEAVVGAIAPGPLQGRVSVIRGPATTRRADRTVLADWLSTAAVHSVRDLEETFA